MKRTPFTLYANSMNKIHFISFNLHNSSEVGAIFIPMLQVTEVRHREVKSIEQGHQLRGKIRIQLRASVFMVFYLTLLDREKWKTKGHNLSNTNVLRHSDFRKLINVRFIAPVVV